MTRPRWRPPGWTGRAGVGRRSIAPPVGIRMRNWGYGDADVSRGAHSDLTATVLAIDADGGPALLVTADLGWWRTMEDFEGVRSIVAERSGVPAERILLHLTHTHAGPSICRDDVNLPGGEFVPGYLDALGTSLAEAAVEALSGRSPSLFCAVSTCHPLAVNRDLTADDRALLGFDPSAPADQTLLVVRITHSDGAPLATLVNYACHPTTLGFDNDRVSPDFVGAMRTLVEAETGAPCLFLQGASGELSPRLQYLADTETADRHGRSLGYAVLAVLETLPAPGNELRLDGAVESGAPLAIWVEREADWPEETILGAAEVPVRLKDLPPIADLETLWRDIDPRSRDERLRRARRLRRSYADMDAPIHRLWVWRLGEIAIVAHPGEAYSDLQTTLRSSFPGAAILVLNLTNGPGWVYLPSRAAYDARRYQSWQTIVREGTLESLIDAAGALLRDLGFRGGDDA